HGRLDLQPALARDQLHAERALRVGQVLLLAGVELAQVPGALEMKGLGGHVGCGQASGATCATAAESLSQVASSDWGRTRICPSTGMKLLSPFQRGTMWACRWAMLPPAADPRLKPMFTPSGFMAAESSRF